MMLEELKSVFEKINKKNISLEEKCKLFNSIVPEEYHVHYWRMIK